MATGPLVSLLSFTFYIQTYNGTLENMRKHRTPAFNILIPYVNTKDVSFAMGVGASIWLWGPFETRA